MGSRYALLAEELKFELERVWTAPYLGLVLMLLILGSPMGSGPAPALRSPLEVALSSVGPAKQLLLSLVAVLTFANSFGRDIEEGVLMDELTLPVGRGALFAVKLAGNYLVILLADFASTLFSTWLAAASVPFTPVASVVLADAAYLLLYVSTAVLTSVVLRSRFGALVVGVAVYLLESVVLLSASARAGDPVSILLRLILLKEVTFYTWGVLAAHLLLPLAILSSAFLYVREVMELD